MHGTYNVKLICSLVLFERNLKAFAVKFVEKIKHLS